MSDARREFKEQVRAATDIVDLISADTPLTRAGREWCGLSPFTGEKTPSFYVNRDKGVWHDFSGGGHGGGDVFEYVMQRDSCSFGEALCTLAESAGLSWGEDDEAVKAEIQREHERCEVYRLLTTAALWFHNQLTDEVRQWVRNQYGVTDDTIDYFKLGYSPPGVLEHLQQEHGATPASVLSTGLLIQGANGDVHDFFNHRLTIPFWQAGKVKYLSGRRTPWTPEKPWERAKYRNLPTAGGKQDLVSPAVRNDTLFNRDGGRPGELLLVTEGLTDCMAAQQAGYATIAIGTTNLNRAKEDDLVWLAGKASHVVLCFDSEQGDAGLRGAVKVAQKLHAVGVDVRMATLPRATNIEKVDLADFLRSGQGRDFASIVDMAPRLPQFLIDAIRLDTPRHDLAKKLGPILDVVAQCDAIARAGHYKLICSRFDISKKTLDELVGDRVAQTAPSSKAPRRSTSQRTSSGSSSAPMRGDVLEGDRHYYISRPPRRDENGPQSDRISNFVLRPVEIHHFEDGREVLLADATTDTGQTVTGLRFETRDWNSARSFKNALTSMALCFTGSDMHVQGIRGKVGGGEVPVRVATQTMGVVETAQGRQLLHGGGMLGPEGPVKEPTAVLFSVGSPMAGRYALGAPDVGKARQTLEEAIPHIMGLNLPEVMLPSLGWTIASMFRPQVFKHFGHFPHLSVSGSKGAGKSTLKRQLLRLIGHGRSEFFDAGTTPFALVRLFSATNCLPVVLDEYRCDGKSIPRHRLEELHRMLRCAYDGYTEIRGRADLETSRFTLTAPVCLIGESRPDDAALTERIVSVRPSRNTIEQGREHRRAMTAVKSLGLEAVAPVLWQYALSLEVDDLLRDATRKVKETIERLNLEAAVPTRCRDNLAVVLFGLEAWHAFGQHHGLSQILEVDDEVAEAAIVSTVTDLMDGPSGSRDGLDAFLETCSAMAANGVLDHGKHYLVLDHKDSALLCLRLQPVFTKYREHQHRVGEPMKVQGEQALRRLIEENLERGGYIRGISVQTPFDDGRKRAVRIDLDAIEGLDLEGFDTSKASRWGGARDQNEGSDREEQDDAPGDGLA